MSLKQVIVLSVEQVFVAYAIINLDKYSIILNIYCFLYSVIVKKPMQLNPKS